MPREARQHPALQGVYVKSFADLWLPRKRIEQGGGVPVAKTVDNIG